MKCNHAVPRLKNLKVAPVRERGLKSYRNDGVQPVYSVAPVRERGLKSWTVRFLPVLLRRSRKGAWIEIRTLGFRIVVIGSLP